MRRFLFLGLLVALAAPGCRRVARREPFVLRIATVGPFAPVDPGASGTMAAAAGDLIYQPVFQPDPAGRLTSVVAESWEKVGPARFRMTLARDLKFSDGSPVTSDDVLRSLRSAGFEAEQWGDRLEFEPRAGATAAALLFAPVFKETASGALGTGPFAVAEQTPERIVLRRVRPAPGRIERVEFLGYPTARDAFARALRGDANAVATLDDRQSELLDGIPRLKIVRSVGPQGIGLMLNARRLDTRARSGLAHALPLSDVRRAYSDACRTVGSSYPAAPVPPGPPVDVLTSTLTSSLWYVALAARRAWGIRGGEARTVDPRSAFERLGAHEFDAAVTDFLAWPPLVGTLYWKTRAALNWSGYSNPAVDRAYDAGDYEAARREMERDPPVVFLCRRERIAAVDARIENPTLGTWGLLDTLPGWEVAP